MPSISYILSEVFMLGSSSHSGCWMNMLHHGRSMCPLVLHPIYWWTAVDILKAIRSVESLVTVYRLTRRNVLSYTTVRIWNLTSYNTCWGFRRWVYFTFGIWFSFSVLSWESGCSDTLALSFGCKPHGVLLILLTRWMHLMTVETSMLYIRRVRGTVSI